LDLEALNEAEGVAPGGNFLLTVNLHVLGSGQCAADFADRLP